jgi:hypothetical protein
MLVAVNDDPPGNAASPGPRPRGVAHLPGTGVKFGQRPDLVLMQRELD